jgi:biopolymer transport protein ExbD
MPVKLDSKVRSEDAEARIEIIPLIDIMFFLLAAFMLVSLSMVNLKSIKVNLPTATNVVAENQRKDFSDISVDKAGSVFLDKKRIVNDRDLVQELTVSRRANPRLRVFISGDRDARHGDIIHVLDLVRTAGIDKVAFEIGPLNKAAKP